MKKKLKYTTTTLHEECKKKSSGVFIRESEVVGPWTQNEKKMTQRIEHEMRQGTEHEMTQGTEHKMTQGTEHEMTQGTEHEMTQGTEHKMTQAQNDTSTK